jgi:WD40 repeat protein
MKNAAGTTLWTTSFEERCYGVAFSADSAQLFAGTSGEEILVFEAMTGKPRAPISGSAWGVSLRASPDGKHLITAGEDGIVTLYALKGAAATQVWHRTGHENWVAAIAWTPDSHLVATAGHDSTIRVWGLDATTPPRELEDHTGSVRALAFSPSGEQLASGGYDQSVRLWDLGRSALHDTPFMCDGQIKGLLWTTDGSTLIAAGSDHRIVRFALGSDKEPVAFTGQGKQDLMKLAATADRKTLFTGGEDGKVLAWSVADERLVGQIAALDGEVSSLCVSPDGKMLACGCGRAVTVLGL